MLSKIKARLSFANVVSCVALFVALGGASYAAINLPKNSVGTSELKKNAVVSSKVKNRTLRRADFATGLLAPETGGREGSGSFCSDDNHEVGGEICDEAELTFPRAGKVLLVATGTALSSALDDLEGPGSSGDDAGRTEAWCRVFRDDDSVSSQVTVSGHHANQYVPFALTALAPVSQGAHTFSLRCMEADGDVALNDLQLSVVRIGKD